MNGKQSIYLIGFMGAGKSTLGRQLANSLHQDYYDTDEIIERKLETTISGIFGRYGEDYFRWVEGQVCRLPLDGVIATGGGCPMYYSSLKWMKDKGLVIFIDTPFETMNHRIISGELNRPLSSASDTDKMINLYNLRLPTYRQAHLRFSPTSSLAEDVKELIVLIDHYRRDRIL